MSTNLTTKNLLMDLPIELKRQICQFSTKKVLSNLRLANKTFACIGAEYLVKNLHLMYTSKSMDNILFISQHPTLRNHVVEITFEPMVVNAARTEDAYYHLIEDIASKKHGSDNTRQRTLNDPDYSASMRLLWELYNDQLYVSSSFYHSRLFWKLVGRFPSLKGLEIITDQITPSDHMIDTYKTSPGGEYASRWKFITNDPFNSYTLTSITEAVTSGEANLQKLVISHMEMEFFMDFSKQNIVGLRPSISAFFSHLRHIDLGFSARIDGFGVLENVTAEQAEFGHALKSATALESLRLTFGHDGPEYLTILQEQVSYVNVHGSHVLQDTKWHNLRHIDLSYLSVTLMDLSEFFRNHSRTLRRVGLHHMWMLGEKNGWDCVFNLMSTILNLEDVGFSGSWVLELEDGSCGLRDVCEIWQTKLSTAILAKKNCPSMPFFMEVDVIVDEG